MQIVFYCEYLWWAQKNTWSFPKYLFITSKHIFVPIDFSEQSHIAQGQSYNLAKHFRSIITLLHIAENSEKEAQSKLDKSALEISTQPGLQAWTMIVKGKWLDQIVRVAEKTNAVAIILGFNSSKGIMELLEKTSCPVITIRGKSHHDGCRNIVLPLDLTLATREKGE